MEELFNPRKISMEIGEPTSNVFACGKNDHTELTF